MTETKIVEWGNYDCGKGIIHFHRSINLPEDTVPINERNQLDGKAWGWAELEARSDGLWMKTSDPVPTGLYVTPVFEIDDNGNATRMICLGLTDEQPWAFKLPLTDA